MLIASSRITGAAMTGLRCRSRLRPIYPHSLGGGHYMFFLLTPLIAEIWLSSLVSNDKNQNFALYIALDDRVWEAAQVVNLRFRA